MGEVYKARDTQLKRDVAIKIPPAGFALDPERMSRFEREVRLLASRDRPNFGAIYGLEESNTTQALILALIEGPTLADRIAAASPDGRELFYLSDNRRIMVADYTATGTSFSSNKPRVWSDRQIWLGGNPTNVGLAPDGTRFAAFPMPEPTAEDNGAAHVTFLRRTAAESAAGQIISIARSLAKSLTPPSTPVYPTAARTASPSAAG